MAVLITGGSGFIGAALARALTEQGKDVVVFDRVINESLFGAAASRIKAVQGDIAVFSEVLNVVKDYQVTSIVHLGAMLSMPSDANPWAAYQVNANGTMHILEAARLLGVQKVVFSSSNAVYGASRGAIDDDTIRKPGSMYGITKLFGEHLGLFYNRKFGLDFRAIRFCVIIGLGARTKHMSQYMAWMIEQSLAGNPFEVWVTEDTNNPWLYHKDAVRALAGLHDAQADRIKSRVYNMAGTASNARQFVAKVNEHIPGARISFNPDPEAVALLGKGIESIDETAAKSEWDWRIDYDLDRMITDMKADFSANPTI
jgi:threonine 3-dehydrogenase